MAIVLTAAATATSADTGPSPPDEEARRLLASTDVQGGLIVHFGCGDGKLTADLGDDVRFIVQGLDADAANIAKARARILSRGLYGRVSAERSDGRNLPYIDNLVNLFIARDLGDLPMSEVDRVLCPNGVALINENGRWSKKVKPWPTEIDEWTHYLHDPQGTMVSSDEVVGLPRRLQWVGGPKWMRNHDFMASLTGMVSSGGRIFYIVDEGLRNHVYLPARWAVVARDAFNGTLLWKRTIDSWFPHTFPFKSGPGHLPRRIVADGDRVYVTLGVTAPLSVLDAATGRTIRTYDRTEATEEIVLSDGVLYLLVDPDKDPFPYRHASDNRNQERNRVNQEFGWSKQSPNRLVTAVSADSGEVLWKHENNIASLTLAVDRRNVFFYDGEHVVALDRKSGRKLWDSQPVGNSTTPATGYAPRLIVGDGVVLLSTKSGRGGRLVGVSSENGDVLWRSQQLKSGHFSPEDLYLIDGVVWTAQTGGSQTKGIRFQAVDARTGETKHDFVAENWEIFFMHQRCYPGRATKRYIMTSGTGTEFLELGTEYCELHQWLRGACIYGLMPANGLLYKTPDSCACYYQSKLHHLCALAPAGGRAGVKSPARDRLEKGPAYREGQSELGELDADCWPTYRSDNARSGAAATSVPPELPELPELWQADVGGKLSTMTSAGGKIFVAAIDRHTVHALDADSGKTVWTYTAGGRVDSPPTIAGGLVLFGCGDGSVYCLKASDGRLVWRFRAAPAGDKLVSYQQVESVWPLHGSVLVRDGAAYCVAGRSRFVDGGLRLVRLDCATGKLLSETVLGDKDPLTGENIQTLGAGKAMPVANADLLSCDGRRIYMGAEQFDLDGNPIRVELVKGKERNQTGEGRHLFCPTGLLDDYWFHRSYWIYGKNAGEGHGEYPVPRNFTPCGRIMVFDESNLYASISENLGNNINPRTFYSLYAASKDAVVAPPTSSEAQAGRRKDRPKTPRQRIPYLWRVERSGILAGAMVLTGGTLFMAGPPDVADEENTYGFVYGADDEIHRQMDRQEEAWLGKQGAVLSAVSAADGEKLSQRKIAAIPVWDGMIAVGGRLYLALKDGTVLCLGSR